MNSIAGKANGQKLHRDIKWRIRYDKANKFWRTAPPREEWLDWKSEQDASRIAALVWAGELNGLVPNKRA